MAGGVKWKMGRKVDPVVRRTRARATAGLSVDPGSFTFPSEGLDQVIDWVFVSPPWELAEKRALTSELSDYRAGCVVTPDWGCSGGQALRVGADIGFRAVRWGWRGRNGAIGAATAR